MSYVIIEFEDGLHLVPNSWLQGDNFCFWPNSRNQFKINKLVLQNAYPNMETWTLYSVKRIFGTANNYEKGKEKLKKFMELSEVESSSESDILKRKRKFRTYDDFLYEPINGNSVENETREENPESSLDPDDHSNRHVSLPVFPKPPEVRIEKNLAATNQSDQNSLSGSQQEFQRTVLKKLNHIMLRLKIIEENMKPNQPNFIAETSSEIEQKLPLKNVDDLVQFESYLAEEINYNKVVNFLKGIGGEGQYSVIVNLLKRLLTNSLAEKYSWFGMKQKHAFKGTILARIILYVTRFHMPTVTEDAVATIIGNWLKYSKQRRERAEMKEAGGSTLVTRYMS